MTSSRSIILLVLIAVTGLTVAPLVGGAVGGPPDSESDSTAESSHASDTNVSTFMQSSATETEGVVDAGLHESKYDAAESDQEAIVLERIDDLETQRVALEAERDALQNEDTDRSPGEQQARMTQLTVEIQSLERSIDQLEEQADETGVDEEQLGTLQENAAALAGPEVAERAQQIGGPPIDPGNQPADGDRGQGESGQPADTGPAATDAAGSTEEHTTEETGETDHGNQE